MPQQEFGVFKIFLFVALSVAGPLVAATSVTFGTVTNNTVSVQFSAPVVLPHLYNFQLLLNGNPVSWADATLTIVSSTLVTIDLNSATSAGGAYTINFMPRPTAVCTPQIQPVPVPANVTYIGNGQSSSCTETAIRTAMFKSSSTLATPGYYKFNCGSQPVSITISHEILLDPGSPDEATDNQPPTVIDGSGLVTLVGAGTNRILGLHGLTYYHVTPTVTLQNIAFSGGYYTNYTDGQGGGAVYFGISNTKRNQRVNTTLNCLIQKGGGATLQIINSDFYNNQAPGGVSITVPDVCGPGTNDICCKSCFNSTTGTKIGVCNAFNANSCNPLNCTNTCAAGWQTSAGLGQDTAGGAINYQAKGGGVFIVGSRFWGNSASNGGAVGCLQCQHLSIYNSWFGFNHANGGRGNPGNGGNGGAISYDGGDGLDLEVCGTTFASNIANDYGGALFRTDDVFQPTTIANFNKVVFDRNRSGYNIGIGGGANGGALYLQGGHPQLIQSFFTRNNGGYGGALYQGGGIANSLVQHTLFVDNLSSGLGGAFVMDSTSAGIVDHVTVSSNYAAAFDAGAVVAQYAAPQPWTLSNSIFYNQTGGNIACNPFNAQDCGSFWSGTPTAVFAEGGNNYQWPHKSGCPTSDDVPCSSSTTYSDVQLPSLGASEFCIEPGTSTAGATCAMDATANFILTDTSNQPLSTSSSVSFTVVGSPTSPATSSPTTKSSTTKLSSNTIGVLVGYFVTFLLVFLQV